MQDGKLVDVSLADNLGKANTVLLFFPGAFTPPCTVEFCQHGPTLGAYRDLDAVVWGISADTAFSQAAWAKQEGIDIPLLADYNRVVITAYDALLADLAGMGPSAARAAIVVNRHGVVRYSEQTATPLDMPNFDAIRAVLQKERQL